jgi:nucleotide-binding universal stress UspA family protein
MRRVIDHAYSLAEVHDAEIHFLYVVGSAGFAALPMETSRESVSSMLRDEGKSALQAVKREADTDRVAATIVQGPPSREIVGYADENGCDLVVMAHTAGEG